MNSLTIKARIIFLGMLAIGGVLLSGCFGIYQLSRLDVRLEEDMQDVRDGVLVMLDIQAASVDFKTQVQEWKNILIRGNNEEQFVKYEKAFHEKEQAVQAKLRKALDALRKDNDPANAGVIADLDKIVKAHAELGVAYKSALAGFNKADPEAGKKVDVAVKGKDRVTTEGLAKVLSNFEKSEMDHLGRQIVEAKQMFVASRNVQIGLIVLVLILSAGVILVTIRTISAKVLEVQQATAEIKATLNLTRRIPVSGQDELAQVAGSVNSLLDEFQAVVKRMKGTGEHVSKASGELSHSVSQLSSAVDQQNEATSAMAAAVEEMSVSVTHVSDSSSAAQQIAQDSLSKAESGGQVIESTVREMLGMASTVQSTAVKMEDLGKRTDQIGSIAGVIKDIADQTNLLALNAAIEAARAGEQGRGFAVVADEVRKLAERTTAATSEISGVILAIQTETRSAVADMSQVVSQVNANAEGARQAGESISQIRDGSSRVVEVTSEIALALREQSSASEMIAQRVEVIASQSEVNANAMGEAKMASDEMKRVSTELHEIVERFRV